MLTNALGFPVAPPLSLTGVRPEEIARHARECRAAVERIGDPLSVMAPRPFRERWRMVSDGARWAADQVVGWAEDETDLNLKPQLDPETGPERSQIPHFVAARVGMHRKDVRPLTRVEWTILIGDYLAAVTSCRAVYRPLTRARLTALVGPWQTISSSLSSLRTQLLTPLRTQHPGWDEAVAAFCCTEVEVPFDGMTPLLATVDRAEVDRLLGLTMADVGNPDNPSGDRFRAWDIAELADWRI